MKLYIGLAVIAALSGAAPSSASESAADRAGRNYQRLMAGQVQWPQLSPAERQELLILIDRLRANSGPRPTAAERCWAAELKRSGTPTLLAIALIELRCGKRPQPPEEEAAE